MLSRGDFVACYERGRRVESRHFVVFALPRPGQDAWRVGLAVTRKLGTAARRNRIKRVLREFFRLNQRGLPPATDIVVVAKRGLDAREVHLAMVTRELLPLLRKGLVRNGGAAGVANPQPGPAGS